MKIYWLLLVPVMLTSCNKFKKQSRWDKECLEEPFGILWSSSSIALPGYQEMKRNKVFIWDEKDLLFTKLRELESTDEYKEERAKIFQSNAGGDIVRIAGSVGDEARELVRESSFYKTCINFFENTMKQCQNCTRSSIIYFRWNVSDFSNASQGSVVDFRKFKEPDYKMKFE